jgi:murein DD-endopeptidase MepM/ murein hydrolase activator NlpD
LILAFLLGYTFYAIGYAHCAGDVEQGVQVRRSILKKESAQHKGFMYYFPVQPPEYCNYTGYKQGDHHDYPASDIFAPFGTPVIAVSDGTVEWISKEDMWDPSQDDPATRGGIAIALRGDDNVRYYYAHLSRFVHGIKLGMRLKAGQIIGYVGKSGNARFTPPHLHFGISEPTAPDDWQTRRGQIWPGPYLDAWRKGQMLTPKLPIKDE